MQNPQSGVMIGIPTLGRPVPLDWANMWKSLNPPLNFNQLVTIIPGQRVADARNFIAQEAIKRNSKYLFFLGDDTEPPPDILKKFIYLMEMNSNIGIIGGVYCSKSNPPAPLVFRGNGNGPFWDWKVGEFFEVTGLGMDATIIRVDVFKDLQEKIGSNEFFRTVDEDEFEDGVNSAVMWTEDLWFLKQVKEHTDWKIFCDGSMLCKHHDVYSGKVYGLPLDSYPVTGTKRTSNKKLKVANLGSGGVSIVETYPNCDIINVDIRDDAQPDYRCDLRSLPFENGYFDVVYSSHVLEHFGRKEILPLLKEWKRVLKPGGVFHFIVPNLTWAVENYEQDDNNHVHVYNVMFGGQDNDYDFHKSPWNERIMSDFMMMLKMKPASDPVFFGYNMEVKYKKPGGKKKKEKK